MVNTPAMTPSEYALIGLHPQDQLPAGGQALQLTVCGGSGSAKDWTDELQPFFSTHFGIKLEKGSLNLWAAAPIEWEAPRIAITTKREWELCPLILEEQAIGVAIRANRETPRMLETISLVHLRTRLRNPDDGAVISVRLLPGTVLAVAN